MLRRLFLALSVLFLLPAGSYASHIVGNDFTYKFLTDTFISGVLFKKYKVSLFIYQDCNEGDGGAIVEDNPAFFTVYRNDGTLVDVDNGIFFDPTPGSGGSINVPANFSNECVTSIPKVCLFRKRFDKIYYLPPSASGYTVVYQRCCRNASIVNIVDPGNKGATYICTIPPTAIANNSAEFRNYPPQIICVNNPLVYDHSAFDADSDSLSYTFCESYEYTGEQVKPLTASPPPYSPENYMPGFTYANPMIGSPPISIDPLTGIITGTPSRIGRFLVTVCCNEWRQGILINTTKREFQFVVTNCSKVVVADIPALPDVPNTFVVNCKDKTVQFINKSKGGFNYVWSFGVNGAVSSEFEPRFAYPDSGTYTVKLVVNPGTTCPDSITRLVKLYPTFETNFTDSGKYCPGSPIAFTDLTQSTVQPISKWLWTFGDGTSSDLPNPTHTYAEGSTYNVRLAAENSRSCRDTIIKKVIIQDFRPFAGDDTIIVKGESIRFDAKGGTSYTWSPSDKLSDTSISNPIGTYPDTGTFTYCLLINSNYGCTGYDTIRVRVVDNVSFVIPNAFTPNGDGLNDYLRPRAVGYRRMKYFIVYSRYGEEVYKSESLEAGWNGTHRGRPADIGVYYWHLIYVDRFGNEGYLKGDVTLLR
jgi:gliding motility-associated-like protein